MVGKINWERLVRNLNPKENKTMETKSRYEIIADLEEKKSNLMSEQANLGLNEARLNRNIESAKEDLKDFEEGKDIIEANLKDQIASIEKSLERLNAKQKK